MTNSPNHSSQVFNRSSNLAINSNQRAHPLSGQMLNHNLLKMNPETHFSRIIPEVAQTFLKAVIGEGKEINQVISLPKAKHSSINTLINNKQTHNYHTNTERKYLNNKEAIGGIMNN